MAKKYLVSAVGNNLIVLQNGAEISATKPYECFQISSELARFMELRLIRIQQVDMSSRVDVAPLPTPPAKEDKKKFINLKSKKFKKA